MPSAQHYFVAKTTGAITFMKGGENPYKSKKKLILLNIQSKKGNKNTQ